ncbi:MAG: 3-dehydroquinate synthase, partial [Caulobacteraceae bacterium]|nr:3-dehydroquinate synthase [Caulobacter sp.]
MSPPVRELRVQLGERAYPVLVGPGLLARAGALLAPRLKRARVAVVADATVARLHGETLRAGLAAAGVAAEFVEVPPGEASKSWGELERVCDRLLALGLERGELVAAFGGGVVGDLAGFAAAITKRGLDFVQVPTTLLAQVDSSVGGKTAIDTPRGKNLIGAFHQPRLVLADLDVLATLPDRELRAGLAEVLKHGLLADRGYFERTTAALPALLARDPAALAEAVSRSVEIKADIVARDEREGGVRAWLNLGHTFGHALEAETGFGAGLNHGEAVGLGCALAFRLSAAEGLCAASEAEAAVAGLAAA